MCTCLAIKESLMARPFMLNLISEIENMATDIDIATIEGRQLKKVMPAIRGLVPTRG